MHSETLPSIGVSAAPPLKISPSGRAPVEKSPAAATVLAPAAIIVPPARVSFAPPPPRIDEYQILRPIGRGAMGRIFLGRDTALDRAVAVKFIATQLDAEARERFLIEARAIARLHHPNVVSVFRVGEIDGLPYLVSEFIDGQSLDKLHKPLPWARALSIALGLVSGLAAAHRQGVLHRDIKSANVMLAKDGTVKLLDFGLAKLTDTVHTDAPRAAAADDTIDAVPRSQHLTEVGALLGTPAYMAPESWLGEPATARSDIYSLGALLYELCSGQTPHYCDDVYKIRRAVIELDAAPLVSVNPAVNVDFAEVIDCCLRREPSERFESAEDLLQALERVSQALAAPSFGAVVRKELRRRWPLTLLVAALMIGAPIAMLYAVVTRHGSTEATVTVSNPRRAVAILGVTADAGSPQLSGAAATLTELLSEQLSAGERLRRIPADMVARMRMELELTEGDPLGPEMLARVHRYASADLVVTGALTASESGELLVSAVVKECPGGTQVAAASARGRAGDLFEVVEELGEKLRHQLGTGELSETQVGELRAARPSTLESAQRFAQGQARLRHYDLVAARDILTRAVAEDPDYALGHFALAGVWSALGHDARAREETERAFQNARSLAREPRILIEARYRELNNELDQALSLYQSLVSFFPDNLEYGLYLANAQLAAGQIASALTTVSQLRLLPAPAREDPRINITQARATIDQADYAAALALLNESVRQGKEMNAPLLTAKARLEMAYVYHALGQHKDALRCAAQAQKVYDAAGDQAALADTLIVQGVTYGFLGQLDASADVFNQALSRLLDIENNALVAAIMSNMAVPLVKQGKLELALARAEAGLTWGRELDSKESIGAAEITIGWIAALRGQPEVARKHFNKSEKVFGELGDPRLIAWVDWHNGQLLAAEGRLAEATEKHERALALREKYNLKGFAAESRVALAELALEQGKPIPAVPLLRLAVSQFRHEGRADSEAVALSLLGHALVALDRAEEARDPIARATALVRSSEDALVRAQVSRLLAELAAREAQKNKDARAEAVVAEEALLKARAEVRSIGIAHEALRIELALCHIEAALGRNEQAAMRADALVNEARGKGFLVMATKAGEVRAGVLP